MIQPNSRLTIIEPAWSMSKSFCEIVRKSPCQDRSSSLAVLLAALALSALAAVDARAADEPAAADLYGDPITAGASVRLGTARYRGGDNFVPPLFTAGDKAVMSMSGQRQLTMVEVSTGKQIREIDLGKQNLNGICLSADRESVFALGNEFDEDQAMTIQTIQHLDLATGRLLKTLKFTDRFGANLIIVSPDGRTIVTASGDETLRFWDIASGKDVLTYRFDQRQIGALVFSPDGSLLAASADKVIYLWEWSAGQEPQKIPVGRRRPALAFSPDGAILAVGPDSDIGIALLDVKSHKTLRTLSPSAQDQIAVSSLAFTPDAKSLIAAISDRRNGQETEYRVLVWDVATWTIRQQLLTEGIYPSRVTVSEDGRYVAARYKSTVKVWNLATGILLGGDRPTHDDTIQSVHLSQDGLTAVTAGLDGTIRIWDATTGKQRHNLRHTRWVKGCALSGDGRLVASSSFDNTVRLWDASTGQERFRLPGHGNVGSTRAVAFSADQSRFASWGDDLYLRIWDTKTGKALLEKRVYPPEFQLSESEDDGDLSMKIEEESMSLSLAVFSVDARLLALIGGDSNPIFDVTTGNLKWKLSNSDGPIASLAFSPDGSRLVTSAWGRSIETKLADGRTGFSAAKNHFVRIRDVETGAELFNLKLPDQGPGPVAFSADGQRVAVADRWPFSGSLSVLDAASGAKLMVFENVPADARALSFSGDGKRLGCGFGDGTALVWELKIPEDKR